MNSLEVHVASAVDMTAPFGCVDGKVEVVSFGVGVVGWGGCSCGCSCGSGCGSISSRVEVIVVI